MAYLGKTPSQAVRSRYYYTATGGETSLSGADDNSNVLTFTDGNYVDVSLNGVALVAGTDYNTTTTNTISGLTALVASDVVEVIVYDTFSVFSGNVTGDFTVGGTLTAANITNTGNLNFGDNDKAIFGAGSDLQIYHDGSNSFINDVGTGNLRIGADTNVSITNSTNSTNYAVFNDASAVKLYYGGSKKFETTNTGVDVTGQIDVNSAARIDSSGIVKAASGTAAAPTHAFLNDPDNGMFRATTNTIGFSTAGTERLRIDSSGNVGIGTSPSDFLHIKSVAATNVLIDAPTDNASLTLQCGSSDAGAEGAFVQFIQNTTPKWQLGMNTDNTFRLYNYNTLSEAMQIDSSGNLLVGTTDSAGGTSGTTQGIALSAGSYGGFIGATRTNAKVASLNRTGTDGEIIDFRKNGSTVVSIGTYSAGNTYFKGDSTSHSVGAGDTGVQYNASSSQLRPYAVTSGSTRSDAIDIGGLGARFKDLWLSGGVYLGGTGSANHLDDYEEGTWNPTIIGSSTNPTVTYGGSTSGQYVKIGRVVMLKCDIAVSAISGGSGSARINGVPFNSSGFPAWDSAVFRDADAIKINGQTYRVTGWVGSGVFYITYVGSFTGNCGDNDLSISTIGTGRIQFTTWFTV